MMILNKIKWKIESMFPKKRKKMIQDWDFIMEFDNKDQQEIIKFFENIQSKDHVSYQFISVHQADQLLVLIKIDEYITIQEAHELRLLKKKEKRSFQLDRKTLNEIIYKAEGQNNLNYANYLRFIRARLQPQNKQILEQERYSVYNKYKKDQYWLSNDGKRFTSEEELRCKYNFLLTYRESVKHETAMQDAYRFPFTDIMKHICFKQLVPIHKNSQFRPIILSSLKDYVGSNDEVYFQFVSFMQKWLMFPVIIGLITTFFNVIFQFTADDSPGDFVYALFIMIWSILFITNWQQSSRWLKLKQQSGYNQVWSQHQNIISKKGFQRRISVITGKEQLYLPLFKKIFNYFISIGSCLGILFLSIIFMVLSLNARGFIQPSHKLIYFQQISSWASKGGIFDANTWWGQVPNLVHVIVINVFDQSFYRPLAKKLTKIEMHLSNKTHSDSIILKYFIYQYIITFADLFYIAFVRFDIQGLRQQLLSLFFIDIVRRLIAQTLIPWLRNKHLSYSLKGSLTKKVAAEQQLRHYAIMEVNKQNYQPFDDYLQIITNMGYLVMISSCFPLAPFLIIIAHGVQLLQDRYKMVHIFKRKLPQKFVGMGYWKDIIVFICYTSIVTNILLFAFSSQQIVSIFPKLYESGKDLVYGNTDLNQIFGGAASSIFTAMLAIGNQTLQSIPSLPQNPLNFIFDLAANQTNSTVQNSSLLLNTIGQTFQTVNPFAQEIDPVLPFSANAPINSGGMMLKQFHPPPAQHQVTFVVILFLLEHIFLISFLFLRKMISKRKCLADIYLERKDYKRKIKKYLSKDILANSIRDQAVNKILAGALSGNNQNDPLSVLTKAFSNNSTSSQLSNSSQEDRDPQQGRHKARPNSLIDKMMQQYIENKPVNVETQKQDTFNQNNQKKFN